MSETTMPTELERLFRDDEGALYAGEAAARAIAIIMKLFADGHYSWPEWVDKFSAEIAPPGHYRQGPEAAAAAEAQLRGEGGEINENYARLWLAACEKLLLEKGLINSAELAGRLEVLRDGANPVRPLVVGEQVLVRDVEALGPVHLPIFIRGKLGVVERHLGDFAAPDANQGRQPHYSVRFTAEELWGADKPGNDSLNFTIWQGYLEPA